MKPPGRVVAAVAVTALTTLTPLVPGVAHAAAVPAGQLAYVTASGQLDLVGVMSDGSTSGAPVQIGPVTKVAAPKYVEVSDVVVSADEHWMAWSETIDKPNKRYGKVEVGGRTVVRDNVDGTITTLGNSVYPLGFSGHTLVSIGGYTERLVMTPKPHYVRLPGNAYAVATYSKGVVDVASRGDGRVDRENLRLTTFSGHHTLLHRYVIGRDYRNVTANIDAVSPDGKKLLVERGNHQDFDGIGPSSDFDEYTLAPGYPRRQLGHYGTNAADWRLQTATFVGPNDEAWLALHDYGKTVRGVVVRAVDGRLHLVASNAITVAGSPLGYAVVQPGKWVLDKQSPDEDFNPVPTADAQLWFDDKEIGPIDIQGSELSWVNGVVSGSGSSTPL